MTAISTTEILDYYDGPLVFAGRDQTGRHYIGMALKPEAGEDLYLVTGVRPERLRQFRSGAVDLRTLFLEAPSGAWYKARTSGGLPESLTLEQQQGNLADNDELLPLAGFTLGADPTSDPTVREARARHNTIMELSILPLNPTPDARIRVTTLGSLLLKLQSAVEQAYRDAAGNLPPDEQTALLANSDSHILEVTYSENSTPRQITLEAACTDVFGYSPVVHGLQRLDQILGSIANPRGTDAARVPLAEPYAELTQLVAEHDISVMYLWAHPDSESAAYSRIPAACLHPAADKPASS